MHPEGLKVISGQRLYSSPENGTMTDHRHQPDDRLDLLTVAWNVIRTARLPHGFG